MGRDLFLTMAEIEEWMEELEYAHDDDWQIIAQYSENQEDESYN